MSRQREPERAAALETLFEEKTPTSGVVINDVMLSVLELDALGGGILPGRYWYDRISGFWGREGMAVEGQTLAGMNLGGPLRADASNGNSGVFVNGRQLAMLEAMWLSNQGAVLPNRCWLDEEGTFGAEGGPPLGKIDLGGGEAKPDPSAALFSRRDWVK